MHGPVGLQHFCSLVLMQPAGCALDLFSGQASQACARAAPWERTRDVWDVPSAKAALRPSPGRTLCSRTRRAKPSGTLNRYCVCGGTGVHAWRIADA